MMIPRPQLLSIISQSIKNYPVSLILGPRQCGKTTIAKEINQHENGSYFDLEDPETPLKPEIAKQVLKDLKGLIVIDEFQRQPRLFELIRVLADRYPNPARFLILGSASLDLIKGLSESLAGRVSYIHMSGFNVGEAGLDKIDVLWRRGGLPPAFLANSEPFSGDWRKNYIQSILERDIPQLGIRIPSSAIRRFWQMVAHFHGQVWNAADFARSMGTKEDTARRYLDILTGAFMVRQLQPWYANIGKRLVKSPKIYIRDTGILHSLLGINDQNQLFAHPKLGFSWEGYVIEQIDALTHFRNQMFFYKTHGGAELDVLLVVNGKRYGFEIKYQDYPKSTKSMRYVKQDLKLEKLWIVYPGEQQYTLFEDAEVIPFLKLEKILKEIMNL